MKVPYLLLALFSIAVFVAQAQPGSPGKCNICGCPDCEYLVPEGVVGFYYDPHERPYQFTCHQLQWKMDNSIAIDQDFCKTNIPPAAWEPCKCVNKLGQLLTEFPPPGFGVTAAPTEAGFIPPTRAPVEPMEPVYYDEPEDKLPLIVILGILAILLALCLLCCICCILCYICCRRGKEEEEDRLIRYVVDENDEIVAGYAVFDEDGNIIPNAVYDHHGIVVYGTPCDEYGNMFAERYTDSPDDVYEYHKENIPYQDGYGDDTIHEQQIVPVENGNDRGQYLSYATDVNESPYNGQYGEYDENDSGILQTSSEDESHLPYNTDEFQPEVSLIDSGENYSPQGEIEQGELA